MKQENLDKEIQVLIEKFKAKITIVDENSWFTEIMREWSILY